MGMATRSVRLVRERKAEGNARKGADYLRPGVAGGRPFHGLCSRTLLTKAVRGAMGEVPDGWDIQVDLGEYKPKGGRWRVLAAVVFVQ